MFSSPVLVNVIILLRCTFLSLMFPFSFTVLNLFLCTWKKIESTPKHELIVDCDLIRMGLDWSECWTAKSSSSYLGNRQLLLLLGTGSGSLSSFVRDGGGI